MKKDTIWVFLFISVLTILIGSTVTVSAEDTQIAAGIGVGLAPDYEGSEDYEAVPLPYLNVKWSNHMSINWLGNKAKVNLIPSSIWKGGVVGEYIGERDDEICWHCGFVLKT